jgi:hypothetical protein
MTKHAQPPMTKYEQFLQQAQQEMLAFEQRESEFRKQDREERAERLAPADPAQRAALGPHTVFRFPAKRDTGAHGAERLLAIGAAAHRAPG